MSAKQISQWRTFLFGILVMGLLAAVLIVIVTRVAAPDAQVVALFSSLCTTAWIAILGHAGKSGVEHLAAGGGVKGAVAALLTDAKPGDPPEAKP